MLRAIVKSVRPHQWVKNLFVAAPLVFARRIGDLEADLRAAAAVAIFCLQEQAESPTESMLHDIPFVVNLVLYAIAAVAMLYLRS